MNPKPDLNAAGAPDDWLRHAQSDLRIARLARQDPDVLTNQIAFHAQQAVEKALKAILVSHEVDFPKKHYLGELIELIQETGIAWPFPLDQVEALTPYAVQTRYPGGGVEITPAKVDVAVETAQQVLAWAKEEVTKVRGRPGRMEARNEEGS